MPAAISNLRLRGVFIIFHRLLSGISDDENFLIKMEPPSFHRWACCHFDWCDDGHHLLSSIRRCCWWIWMWPYSVDSTAAVRVELKTNKCDHANFVVPLPEECTTLLLPVRAVTVKYQWRTVCKARSCSSGGIETATTVEWSVTDGSVISREETAPYYCFRFSWLFTGIVSINFVIPFQLVHSADISIWTDIIRFIWRHYFKLLHFIIRQGISAY